MLFNRKKEIKNEVIKAALDYNNDNIVDVKDIIDASKEIESDFSKYTELLKQQVEEARKAVK